MDCQASGAKVGVADGVNVTVAESTLGEDNPVAEDGSVGIPAGAVTVAISVAIFVAVDEDADTLPVQAATTPKRNPVITRIDGFFISNPF
jgi:ABC-type thiamine transport system substrate-binding protein